MNHRILAAAIGTVLLGVGAQGVQAATSGIYFRLGDGSAVSVESTTDPVFAGEVHHYDYGSSFQHAAASAAQQTTRARTTVEQYGSEPPGSWITADTEAYYRKDVVVPGGVFGPPGTLITMPLTLRFDGNALASGGLFGDGRALNSIDTRFSFRVLDLNEQVCGEGCRPAEIASFGFSGYVSFDSGFGAAGRESAARFNWSARQGNVTVASDDFDYYNYEKGVFGSGESRYAVNTGTLNLNLTTRTGHTLRLSSSLDVFAQSMANNAWTNVVGDFSRTFDADLLLPGPGGVIDGEVPGAYTPEPVPLPASLWGLGAALAVLGGVGRRRRGAGLSLPNP